MVYHVTTKKRTYNSVVNANRFRKTRRLLKDFSGVATAFRWNRKKQKWVKAGKKQFRHK